MHLNPQGEARGDCTDAVSRDRRQDEAVGAANKLLDEAQGRIRREYDRRTDMQTILDFLLLYSLNTSYMLSFASSLAIQS